jgi:hypothetical protein
MHSSGEPPALPLPRRRPLAGEDRSPYPSTWSSTHKARRCQVLALQDQRHALGGRRSRYNSGATPRPVQPRHKAGQRRGMERRPAAAHHPPDGGPPPSTELRLIDVWAVWAGRAPSPLFPGMEDDCHLGGRALPPLSRHCC